MGRRPDAPSGEPPPEVAVVDGRPITLEPLARRICSEFERRSPDYRTLYGEAAEAWCLHDTKYLLAWAALDVSTASAGALFCEQVSWLARVLQARSFPLDQLVAHLGLAAATLTETVPDHKQAWHELAECGKAAVEATARG